MSAVNSPQSSISILPQGTNPSNDAGILKEGSSVFVRVLSAGKGGQYTVSFAGNRFDVLSQRSLTVGNAFRAMVSVKDGKVFLSPQSLYGRANADSAVERFSSFASDSAGRLTSFLQQLGLPPDNVSLRLVQFFQEAGLRFNTKLATKARNLGLKFPGREDEAAEVALFLENKGINADMDSVMELLDVLYGDNGKKHRNRKDDAHKDKSQQDEDVPQTDGNSGIEDVSQSKPLVQASNYAVTTSPQNSDLLDELYDEGIHALDGQAGLLTFINHYSTNSLHWVILPFEYGDGENRVNGTIRILLDTNNKITKKIAISAFFYRKTYIFMIDYNSGSPRQKWVIEYCSQPSGNLQDTEYLNNLLVSLLPESLNFSVRYNNALFEGGFFTLGTNIPIVKVDV